MTGNDAIEPPALEARELYRFYHAGDDEVFALRGISLAVARGEVVAVVGPSGSGKSTLVACLAGLDEPDGGHTLVAGHRLTRRPEPERARLRARWIGVLLQSGNLLDHLTVAQNVRAAASLVGHAADRRSVGRRLDEVGLSQLASARPATLSGGEMARAGLAVALANDPAALLADEPTAEVDSVIEGTIVELLRARAAAGTAILLVTHSHRTAVAADRVVHLANGAIIGA